MVTGVEKQMDVQMLLNNDTNVIATIVRSYRGDKGNTDHNSRQNGSRKRDSKKSDRKCTHCKANRI